MSADADFDRALREELDRRVTEVASYPEDAFRLIPTAELVVTALVTILFPLVVVWLFR